MTTFFCRLQPLISTPPEITSDQWHNSPLRLAAPSGFRTLSHDEKSCPSHFGATPGHPGPLTALEVSRDVSSINACDAVDSGRSLSVSIGIHGAGIYANQMGVY